MSDSIPAIYDSGVFRPLEPVNWPEGTRAEVVPLACTESGDPQPIARAATWPARYFEQTAGALANEDFDRPAQGSMPQRNHW